MKNWYWASLLFAVGYVVGTILGFATYCLGITEMWVSLFVAMPPLFAYLSRVYLARVRCERAASMAEMSRLVSYWIALALGLDALVYIVMVPVVLHADPNWTFFIDQSPWIWICYATMMASGYVGRYFHDRHLEKAPSPDLGAA